MGEGRPVPVWAQAVAAGLGVLVAVPFAYVTVVEWVALVRLGGWFSYALAAWAVAWVGWFVAYLGRDVLERRHAARLARAVVRTGPDAER